MSSFLDSTGLSELATKLKNYFCKQDGNYPTLISGGTSVTRIGSTNVDLDDYKGGSTVKFYMWSAGEAANVANKPYSDASILVVYPQVGNPGYARQVCYRCGAQTVATREYIDTNQGWTTWREMCIDIGSYTNLRSGGIIPRSLQHYTGTYQKIATVDIAASDARMAGAEFTLFVRDNAVSASGVYKASVVFGGQLSTPPVGECHSLRAVGTSTPLQLALSKISDSKFELWIKYTSAGYNYVSVYGAVNNMFGNGYSISYPTTAEGSATQPSSWIPLTVV